MLWHRIVRDANPTGIAKEFRLSALAMASPFETSSKEPLISRRGLLAVALAGGGLALGYAVWPRRQAANLAAAEGESIFNEFLKIGGEGHITFVCPQTEMGQGASTLLAQIVADELGADWRTIAIEHAPINSLYDNPVLAEDWRDGYWPAPDIQATGSSSSQRAFETKVRLAAAGARTLLFKAAAKRWDTGWDTLKSEDGFVLRGQQKLRFGELASEAAGMSLPDEIPLRTGGKRLAGRGVNRLDVPAKLDGSANFAADIRLPDMVFAAIRQGPPDDARLTSFDRKAAAKVPGAISVIDHERWIAVAASTWWAANLALDAARAKFTLVSGLATDASVASGLDAALKQDGTRFYEVGDPERALAGDTPPFERRYEASLAPHASLEPMSATAVIENGQLQLWLATQAPAAARRSAAEAIGIDETAVVVHAMLAGGSFGRKYEADIAAQVAILTKTLERPVQLTWSRAEDTAQDRFRPAAKARMVARLGAGGQIAGLAVAIAAPDGIGEMVERVMNGATPAEARASRSGKAHARAVSGAIPPYAIGALSVDHHPADIGVATGKLRGGADGTSCFFTESFIDELAKQSGRDPFSFRMGLLAGNARLAKCLAKVAQRGGWDGGTQGTSQGLACHMMLGCAIAVLAEAQIGDDRRIHVSKLVAVADVGQVLNPDIARQQIEGGLMHGLALATGRPVRFSKGYPEPRRFGDLGLPRLADMPEISVELVASSEPAGGIGELAVPPVGPAIANALFAGSGRRFRTLPLAPTA